MALTEDQLVYIRRHIGDRPDDAALEAIYTRTGDVDELVLEVLETRHANLVANPASFSIPGDYSQDTARNIEALEEKISDLGGGGSTVRVVQPAERPFR